MELVTRIANMLPPERATPPPRLLAPRMERLRREMNALGKLAQGPGYYALARGNLALGEIDQAKAMIDLAWSNGYDTADARYTRGEIQGRLYQNALVKASHINDRELRENTVRVAKQKYLAPALDDLRHSTAATIESPALLEAEIALFEERWDDAIAGARRAAAGTPWLYEANMLEATILRTRAIGEGNAGNVDAALRDLDRAGVVMSDVLRIARSDALAYTEECTRRTARLRIVEFERPLTDFDVTTSVAPCQQAVAIDPEVAAAWHTIARANEIAASARVRLGSDPNPSALAAIAAADRALAIHPDFADAHHARGVALLARGRWAYNHGQDPRPILDASAKSLRRAIELDPRSSAYHNALSNVLVARAYYEDRTGGDPTAFLQDAIVHYERALEVFPGFVLAMSNLGSARVQLADRIARRGGDARPELQKAISALTRAAAKMPANVSVHNNRGNALLTLAEVTLANGEDPAPHAQEAIAALRKAIELRPDYAMPRYNIAYSLRLIAHHRMRRGLDPAAQIAAAETELDRYDALSPGDPDSTLLRARLALVRARYALESGADPRAYLAEAERYARAGDTDGFRLVLAERYRWEAEWLRRRGQNASLPIARGLEAVRSAARTPEAQALEGALLGDRTLIAAALKANRNLRAEYQ